MPDGILRNATREIRDAEVHHLVGGVLCLDFANTLYGHDVRVHEYLYDYRDLVLWSRHVGALTPRWERILLSKWEQRPAESEAVFRDSIQQRERIYRIFSSLAHGGTPAEADLSRLHQSWVETLAHSRLATVDSEFVLDWEDTQAFDRMLWPITVSAVELLISADNRRVKQCGRCDWLFLDRSRNQSRRWCSMETCGNRSKMARRYQHSKQRNNVVSPS